MAVRVSREDALAATGCARLADFLAGRPFDSVDALVAAARAAWWGGNGVDGGASDEISSVVGVPDWLEAFASHPRIGNKGDLKKASERERGGGEAGVGGNPGSERPVQEMPKATTSLSHAEAAAAEQAGAASSSRQTLEELARWNALYERRFGHIFIVCASGRSGDEMLADLKTRFLNPPYAELAIAAEEHIRIAEKRLRGLLFSAPSRSSSGGGGGGSSESRSPVEAAALRTGALVSHLGAAATATSAAATATATTTTPAAATRQPITTHVLDTALGRPAAGVRVRLLSRPGGAPASARAWVPAPGSISTSTAAAFSPSSSPSSPSPPMTDADGRCSALLSPGAPRPPPGVYRIEFDVGEYFERTSQEAPGYGGGGVSAVGKGNGGRGRVAFYPSAAVEFVISPPGQGNDSDKSVVPRPEHLHIPLTFSPFGYSTYRGS